MCIRFIGLGGSRRAKGALSDFCVGAFLAPEFSLNEREVLMVLPRKPFRFFRALWMLLTFQKHCRHRPALDAPLLLVMCPLPHTRLLCALLPSFFISSTLVPGDGSKKDVRLLKRKANVQEGRSALVDAASCAGLRRPRVLHFPACVDRTVV